MKYRSPIRALQLACTIAFLLFWTAVPQWGWAQQPPRTLDLKMYQVHELTHRPSDVQGSPDCRSLAFPMLIRQEPHHSWGLA
jgi:hypothetical protein